MAQIILLLQLALSLLKAQPSTTTIAMATQAMNIAEQVLQSQSSTPAVIQSAPIATTTTIATTTQSVSLNATTTCPDGKPNIVDGPPDPCNPYAFKLSECPPITGKHQLGATALTFGSSVGVPDAAVQEQEELIAEYCPQYPD
jgi:hypothetical protein